MPTICLHITGEVHGVFYRVTAKKVADELKIKGWVKNNDDGSVEVMATGTRRQLEEFIKWCRQGSEKAKVENVIETHHEEMDFEDFTVIRG